MRDGRWSRNATSATKAPSPPASEQTSMASFGAFAATPGPPPPQSQKHRPLRDGESAHSQAPASATPSKRRTVPGGARCGRRRWWAWRWRGPGCGALSPSRKAGAWLCGRRADLGAGRERAEGRHAGLFRCGGRGRFRCRGGVAGPPAVAHRSACVQGDLAKTVDRTEVKNASQRPRGSGEVS